MFKEQLMRWERATPMALIGSVIDKKSAIGVLPPVCWQIFMDETHGWERATPMALMGCVISEKSAIGVARSQQKTLPARAINCTPWRRLCNRVHARWLSPAAIGAGRD